MNDQDLAGLLGDAPAAPDPGFRFDVFARVAERARRRAGHTRAARTIVAFVRHRRGFFRWREPPGFTLADAQPLLLRCSLPSALLFVLAREA